MLRDGPLHPSADTARATVTTATPVARSKAEYGTLMVTEVLWRRSWFEP